MNWPNIRRFPASAKMLIAIYTVLMGCVLVVALSLSAWHHGLTSSKGIEKKGKLSPSPLAAPAASAPPHAGEVPSGGGGAKPDDGQSSGVVIEADSDSSIKVKTDDWFVYDNFKIGHVHLNGQSLIYFSLIVLFLMTGASETSKKVWGALLAFSVILHTFGMFFMHKEAFAMMLRVSGGLLSLSITVMCLYIFVDTIKRPVTD